MKVLFLDIDGVVNSRDSTNFKNSIWPLDPYKAFLIGRIQLETNCDVVLSSYWRHHPEGISEVEKRIVKIIGITGKNKSMRGDEVQTWLDAHPEVEMYAILDDNSDFHPDQHLFKTTFEHGLTDEITKDVIAHLNGVSPE